MNICDIENIVYYIIYIMIVIVSDELYSRVGRAWEHTEKLFIVPEEKHSIFH